MTKQRDYTPEKCRSRLLPPENLLRLRSGPTRLSGRIACWQRFAAAKCEDAERALELVRAWVEDNGLTLHPTKTKIVNATTEGFDFLGDTFRGDLRLPRTKSEQKFKDGLRELTHRGNGHSLRVQCVLLKPKLQGWFQYFRHCHWSVFRELDSWIRMRLRSILRKRQKKRGRGGGKDHQKWTNHFFAEHGLYSLGAAHTRVCQSSPR